MRIFEAYQKARPGAGADVDIESQKIPDGLKVCIEAISLTDLDTADKVMQIGYNDGSKDYILVKKDLSSSEYTLEWHGKIYLDEGRKLIGKVFSATGLDDILLVGNGFYVE